MIIVLIDTFYGSLGALDYCSLKVAPINFNDVKDEVEYEDEPQQYIPRPKQVSLKKETFSFD